MIAKLPPSGYTGAMLIVPLERARIETRVSNSRFIATAGPVADADEAKAFVKAIKAEFPDATHNVPAWIVGPETGRLDFCSDDGEPSGTSGRPLLAVLKGSGLTNAAVVVTRYFGGTLLGTGGLVKAYGDAGKLVLAEVERARLEEIERFAIALPYKLVDRFRTLAAAAGAVVAAEAFEEVVRLEVDVPSAAAPGFPDLIADLSAGSVVPRRLGPRVARIPL